MQMGTIIATETGSASRKRGYLPDMRGRVKDVDAMLFRLGQAHAQHQDLMALAKKNHAQDDTTQNPNAQPADPSLNGAVRALAPPDETISQQDATQSIRTQNDAIKGPPPLKDNGLVQEGNPFPEMDARPDLAIGSAAGIATSAADSTHMASRRDHIVTAGRDMSLSVGRSLLASVARSMSLFAYRGIKAVAAMGKLELRSLNSQAYLGGKDEVTVASEEKKVVVVAKEKVWTGADGSYISIEGNNVTIATPGEIILKGRLRVVDPEGGYADLQHLAPYPVQLGCEEAGWASEDDSAQADDAGADAASAATPAPDASGDSASSDSDVATASAPVPSDNLPVPPVAAGDAVATPPAACDGRIGTVCFKNALRSVSLKDFAPSYGCGDYYAVHMDGSFCIGGDGKRQFLGFSGDTGKFDISYDSKTKSITAHLLILVVPKEIMETRNGVTRSVPFDGTKDGKTPDRKSVPREYSKSLQSSLKRAKGKIENDFNHNNFMLTVAHCKQASGCKCKIPVSFKVDFTTNAKERVHHKVDLYPVVMRADTANWGERNPQKILKGGKVVLLPYGKDHVWTHECCHHFGSPDEYFDEGGAVHKRFLIPGKPLLDYQKALKNADKTFWQSNAWDTIMGHGVYTEAPVVNTYYLTNICKWFSDLTGMQWKAIKS
jgi:uncharacterized protein (DUF2345 family)